MKGLKYSSPPPCRSSLRPRSSPLQLWRPRPLARRLGRSRHRPHRSSHGSRQAVTRTAFRFGQCTWWAAYNHRVTWKGKAWAVFFRSIYGIVRPGWKEWLLGQPWVAFELHCEDFAVTPRCWLPPALEGMLRTLLGSAVPGLQVTSIPDQIALPQPASRARLVPWRESLYPLSQPKADALRRVVRALSGVPHGVVMVVSPDMGHARETPHQQLHDCPEQHSVFRT